MGEISLKFKLMLLLTFTTSTMLAIYGYVALRDFEKDKVAYVKDSGLSQSRFIANQVRSEIENISEKIQFYLRGYSRHTGFHNYSKSVFRYENNFQQILSYVEDNQNQLKVFSQLDKKTKETYIKTEHNEFIKDAFKNQVSLFLLDPDNQLWSLALVFKDQETKKSSIAVGVFRSRALTESLLSTHIYDTFLIDANDKAVVSRSSTNYNINTSNFNNLISSTLKNLNASSGMLEYDSQGETWFVGVAKVGIAGIKVISIMPKDKALEAVKILIVKSGLFLAFLIFVTLILGILSSNQLTLALKKLTDATKKVSQGIFDIEISGIKVKDEIGQLANSFLSMAQEIQRLIQETAEKARMEEELKTAQTVQSSLFPDKDYISDTLEVRGFYQPASECSGDWWYYTKINSKFYFWIGDATGHGVPAALVTSATKSVATVIQELPELSVSKIAELFNRAVCHTSHGKVMMTFFMGCYDTGTNQFTYVNASHDPPFLLSKKDTPLKKRDIKPLIDVNGPRLGENENSQYQEGNLTLKGKDQIIFYTDGVTELYNKDGDMLGERKFIKCLLDSYNNESTLEQSMDNLAGVISHFKGGYELHDDCTYFMFELKQ